MAGALKGAAGVIVFEKALSYGYEGTLCSDLKAALYEHLKDCSTRPWVRNFIAGIGGREIKTAELAETLRGAIKGTRSAETNWLGIKI